MCQTVVSTKTVETSADVTYAVKTAFLILISVNHAYKVMITLRYYNQMIKAVKRTGYSEPGATKSFEISLCLAIHLSTKRER